MVEKILIALLVVCMLILGIGLLAFGELKLPRLPEGEKAECMKYREYPLNDIPAKCVRFFR